MRGKVISKWKWVASGVLAVFLLAVLVIFAILSGYDYNSLKPEIQGTVANATGKELTLGGDISLRIGLTPTLVLRDVSVRNVPWGSEPQMAKIGRFEVKVRLFPLLAHHLDIVRLVLVEPRILLETDTAGRSNFAIEKGAKEQEPGKGATGGGWKLSSVTLNDLSIERGRVTYVNHASKKSYEFDVTSLTASSAGPLGGPIRLRMSGAYNEEPFEAAGTVGSLSAFAGPSLAWPIDLTLRAAGAVLAIDGSIRSPSERRGMKLNFSLKAADPSRLSRLSSLVPRLKGPLDVSGRMTDTGPASYLVSDLRVMQAANSLSGSIELNLAGKRPSVKAALSARSLDLRSYIGPKSAPTGKGRVFSDKPLPLNDLDKVDADVKLRAAEVLVPDIALDNLQTSLVLKDGALDVKSFRAGLGKGTVTARLSLKPQGRTVLWTSSMHMEKVDVSALGNIVKAAKGIEGPLDAGVDATARGTSVAAVMGSMTGRAVIQMGRGRIHNRYIDLLGSDLSTGLFRLFNPFGKETEYTRVNCFVGGLDMRDGLARVTTLVLNTQNMVVMGEGTINLRTEWLNLSLKPVPKAGIGSSVFGKLGISAGELTRPFKLAGTLASPRLAIDPTQTAIVLGKTIGSMALFGPVGIAAALAGKSSDEETSCAAAIAAAKRGSGAGRKKSGQSGESPVDILKGIGGKLKNLFD